MKKLFTLFTILLLTISSQLQGQCVYLTCEDSLTFYLPIYDATEVNNTPGDKCFINQGDTAAWILHPDIAFGQWENMMFKSYSSVGAIWVMQIVAVKSGQHLVNTGGGVITYSSLYMWGVDEPASMYIDNNTTVTIDDMPYAVNGTVYMGEGAYCFINDTEYEIGDTLRVDNNPNNYVLFKECESILLAIGIIDLHHSGNTISWVVDETPVTVKRLINGSIVDQYASFAYSDQFTVKESGYYFVETASSRSNTFYIEATEDTIVYYDIYHRTVDKLELNTPYFKKINNKYYKIIITQ